jgi:hypothetical protein
MELQQLVQAVVVVDATLVLILRVVVLVVEETVQVVPYLVMAMLEPLVRQTQVQVVAVVNMVLLAEKMVVQELLLSDTCQVKVLQHQLVLA